MDKRYQVFVSSTYTDLIEERQRVFHTLMEIGCIPAGMELFSAADEDQFEFIKKIIDDCDYYLLIIGGRYGSLGEDQISFTEKEYDYAVEKGMKIIALVHGQPDTIAVGKTDQKPELKEKLDAFKNKVMTGRMVNFWEGPEDLEGRVSINLNKAIRMYPAIGWVRGNQVASQEILEEINELRKQNLSLEVKIGEVQKSKNFEIENLVNINSKFAFELSYTTYKYDFEHTPTKRINLGKCDLKLLLTWEEIFNLMSDNFLHELDQYHLKRNLEGVLINIHVKPQQGSYIDGVEMSDNYFAKITNQFMAYGLIKSVVIDGLMSERQLSFFLTELGKKRRLENLVVRLPDS